MSEVAARAHIDTGFRGLDAGEVQLLTWGDMQVTPHTLGTCLCSPLEPPSTLSAALGTLGEGPPILSHPVVVERGVPGGMAVQGDGTALRHHSAQGVHTHGQRRRRPCGDTALPPHRGVTRVTRGTAAGNNGGTGFVGA